MRTDPREACANEKESLLWALLHDGVAHPLMALTLFSSWAVKFHNWTSKRAWPRPAPRVTLGSSFVTHQADLAYTLSAMWHQRGIPHVTKSIPHEGGFVYRVEKLTFQTLTEKDA